MDVRDRIKELRRIKASELVQHPKNWRRHSDHQRSALRGVLEEVGIVGVALVRQMDDGRFLLLDGHMRADQLSDQEIPCVVLDVTEEEADKVLLTFDALTRLATTHKAALASLTQSVAGGSLRVKDLVQRISTSRTRARGVMAESAADRQARQWAEAMRAVPAPFRAPLGEGDLAGAIRLMAQAIEQAGLIEQTAKGGAP